MVESRKPAHKHKRVHSHPASAHKQWSVAVGVALLAALGVGGALFALSHTATTVATASVATDLPTTGPAQVEVYPSSGATSVGLNSPISLISTNGKLASVSVSGGGSVVGTVDAGGRGWAARTAALAPNATYTISAETVGPSGDKAHFQSQFSTVDPSSTLTANITPDGQTVGVGTPIIAKFNHDVVNQSAVANHLVVSANQPVLGGWHWFSAREAHFRPESYWPGNVHVTVNANLAGVDAGNGVWGLSNSSVAFGIGDSHVSTVDIGQHVMTITDNGQVVKTIKMSAGRAQYPTMNGVHVVLGKQYNVLMDSQTVGIPRNSPDGYYEHVYDDVQISTGGEYVHAAPWSVGSQGVSNVSHGCVNISPTEASWFFGWSQTGDVVNVIGSPRPPDPSDRATRDWNIPWGYWANGTGV